MRKMLSLLFLVFLSIFVHGQSIVIPVEIGEQVVDLQSTETGHLFYATQNGAYGLFDGIKLNSKGKVRGQVNQLAGEQSYLLSSNGLIKLKNFVQTSTTRADLEVLAYSPKHELLVARSGVFQKVGQEYVPHQVEFRQIIAAEQAEFFQLAGKEYLRLNNSIFVHQNSRWKEVLLLNGEAEIELHNGKAVIADARGIVSFDLEKNSLDSLVQTNFSTIPKLRSAFGQLLVFHDNQVIRQSGNDFRLDTIYNLNSDLVRGGTADDWGNYWVAAGSYLYKIPLQNINEGPNLRFTSLSNGVKGLDLSNNSFNLEKENNGITFRYEVVDLAKPRNLRVEYKLEGFQSDWQSITDQTVSINNIPSGKYTLLLRATNNGQYYTYAKGKKISVGSSGLGSFWFWLIAGISALMLLAYFMNLRYETLQAKYKEDKEKLLARNKILELQHKSLQLQMNPHFVFNCLNSIQGLVAIEENVKAKKYLNYFSQLMRSNLEHSRQESIALEEEVSYLTSYLELENLCRKVPYEFNIEVEESLEDDIKIPSMMIQPFVENAIVHGLKNIEHVGKIDITFVDKSNHIEIEIVDNGVGLKESSKKTKAGHNSLATKVVKERLEGFFGRQHHALSVGEVDKGSGTKVILRLPILN